MEGEPTFFWRSGGICFYSHTRGHPRAHDDDDDDAEKGKRRKEDGAIRRRHGEWRNRVCNAVLYVLCRRKVGPEIGRAQKGRGITSWIGARLSRSDRSVQLQLTLPPNAAATRSNHLPSTPPALSHTHTLTLTLTPAYTHTSLAAKHRDEGNKRRSKIIIMRNLVPISARTHTALLDGGASRISAIAISPEDHALYAATASANPAGDVLVQLLRLNADGIEPHLLASFSTPSAAHAQPALATDHAQEQPEVLSLHYLSDGGATANHSPALCVITAGGDIAVLTLPADEQALDEQPFLEVEIVGSVEQGLRAAAWSPDDELLVLITGATPDGEREKVLLMTCEYEVLSERVLTTDEFGEGESWSMSLETDARARQSV